LKESKVSFLPLLFLFIQPIFMTGNIAVARGAAGLVPLYHCFLAMGSCCVNTVTIHIPFS